MGEWEHLAELIKIISGGKRGEREAGLLMTRFGKLRIVLESNVATIRRGGRLTGTDAALLSIMPGVARRIGCERFGPSPSFARKESALAYVRALYTGARYERFEMLCLDSSLRLIDVKTLAEGSMREADFYPRLLMDALVHTGTTHVLFCHNHPSGRPFFSEADVSSTREAVRILDSMNVTLLDHFLCAGGQVYSLREKNYLPGDIWLKSWK